MTNKSSLRDYLRCESIHRSPCFAEASAQIIARQWNHKQFEINRNINSMTAESKDTLPCHLALVLNIPHQIVEEIELPHNEDIVVGHVKISRADGRSDGACCISYSLVVDTKYRGYGFGRVLTEKAEDCARSLGLSYMYLSTNDKVSFYEHLGYKQCEAVSSLGNNSKLLNANQVNALEGLFAKRLNMNATPTESNTWLRKRLIDEYPLQTPFENKDLVQIITRKMESLYGNLDFIRNDSAYQAFCLPVSWQQQTGPSCGISAMNMLCGSLNGSSKPLDTPPTLCSQCVKGKEICEGDVEGSNALRMAIELGVSSDGELFCAYNFSLVAKKALCLHLKVSEEWSIVQIVDELVSGSPVVVPYDRSLSDHRPGLFGGGKAHWCLITGFISRVGSSQKPSSEIGESCDNESCIMNLSDKPSTISLIGEHKRNEFQESTLIDGDILLVCMHSMSRSPFLCSFQELVQSNQQLFSSKSKFYMAPEGLNHLRGKFLIVNR